MTDFAVGDFSVTASGYRDGSMIVTDTFDLLIGTVIPLKSALIGRLGIWVSQI